jgi:zinc transport system ATP-binding protein
MKEASKIIELINVYVGYTRPVLGPVNFSVSSGEILGITGANGKGKTTLLKAIAGSIPVFKGQIVKAKGTKIMHQGQRPVRSDDIPLLVKEFLELTDSVKNAPDYLKRVLHEPVRSLSGGQYNFMHTWACIGSDADLILLDEPSDNLDQEGMDILFSTLAARSQERAYLIISHEKSLLKKTCDRVMEF